MILGTESNEPSCSQSESGNANLLPSNLSFKDELSKYFDIFSVTKNNQSFRYIRCKICVSNPSIVKMFCSKTGLPSITTNEGTRYRTESIQSHFKSKYHEHCKSAESLKNMQLDQNKASIDCHISQANKQLANHIGKLILQLYTDGKKLTNSAYSWPARYVSAEASHHFDFNKKSETTIPKNIEMQYVNPNSHLELLSTIVKSHEELEEKLKSALAVSIRVDGSVDRTQIDKIYILLKVLSSGGRNELIFLAIGKQTERGAIGLMNAIRNGIKSNVGEKLYKMIILKTSSICTDGTNINSGDKGGLWKLFEDEVRKEGSTLPLLKVWCSAHRMDLVWGDVSKSHKIITKTLGVLSSIASYFNYSGLRNAELNEIAVENSLQLVSLPKIFEIRWTEFTHSLVNNILRSWNALVIYFSRNEADATCSGFATLLTKLENLKTVAFLADILCVFQRYHKKVQSDDLTLLSLVIHLNSMQTALENMKDKRQIGGWEEMLHESVIEDEDGELSLKGIRLHQISSKRVENKTDFDSNRGSIIQSTIDNLLNRFDTDFALNELIEPFINFKEGVDIRKIHSQFAPDLDLMSLNMQFEEIRDLRDSLNIDNDLQHTIKILNQTENYEDVVTVIARIAACTPHSADVERCISANNLLKTSLRNNMSLETEQKYLYVYFNMPTLMDWDPKKAVVIWLNEKERRQHTNLTEKKANSAPYYKGIFYDKADETDAKTIDKSKTKIKF